jgi:hypothetical protein
MAGGWIVAGDHAQAVSTIAATIEMASGQPVATYCGAVDTEDAASRMFGRAASTIPAPRGVVGFVSMHPEGLIGESGEAWWEASVAGKLRQAFLIAQCAVDDFIVSGTPGRLIFVLGWPGTATGALEILESALYSLGRSIAKEYGRKGITCNLLVAASMPPAREDDTHVLELLRFVTSDDSAFINGEKLTVA